MRRSQKPKRKHMTSPAPHKKQKHKYKLGSPWLRRIFSNTTALIAITLVTAAGMYFTFRSRADLPDNVRTPNAVQVACTTPCGSGDDTAKFQQAITAATSSQVRYQNGPTGQSQSVVYVPAGTYRLLELTFPSNLRMEIDAGAVLAQAGGATVKDGAALIRWDGPLGSPLQNVSLVGVGSSTGGIKSKAGTVAAGRTIDNSFTFNMDPADTTASNKTSALMILNTKGFLVTNVFSIQNDFLPAEAPLQPNWYPTSQKAALGVRARSDSPCGGPFAIPTNGSIKNWYNVRGPKGYGPNQIGAAANVSFSNIFTQGGTALRLETDSSLPNLNDINAGKVCPGNKTKFGSEIRGLKADDIEGLNCNRTVSFSPHLQDNYDVHVTNVKSTNCAQAVVLSRSPFNRMEGSFHNSTIANIKVVGGNGAQLGTQGAGEAGYWSIGVSLTPFKRDPRTPWDVIYSGLIDCSGTFQQASDLITPPSTFNNGKPFKPNCPGITDIKNTVVIDNIAPTINLISPTSGQTISGNTVNIEATANDNVAVTKVEFRVGSTLVGTDTTYPYKLVWNSSTVANGPYNLTSKAYDTAGNNATSTAIAITVLNTVAPPPDITPPSVSVSSPVANATVSGTTTITAAATDNIGVAKVELYIDGQLVGTDVAAPYSFVWDTSGYANGSHAITTKAYDAVGNNTASLAVNVTVNNVVPSDLKPGDVNADGRVNIFDAAIVANNWGRSEATRAQGDLNDDRVVNIFDAAIIANNWGR